MWHVLPSSLSARRLGFLFPFNYHCQCRRLHSSDWGQVKTTALRVECSHRSCAVDADKPVGFAPAAGGVSQRLHFVVPSELLKARSDGVRCHRLQPKPRDGFASGFPWVLGLCVLNDVSEDQLALASRVASVDKVIYVVALDQAQKYLQAGLAFSDRLQVKMGWNMRQLVECPFASLDFLFRWYNQLQ